MAIPSTPTRPSSVSPPLAPAPTSVATAANKTEALPSSSKEALLAKYQIPVGLTAGDQLRRVDAKLEVLRASSAKNGERLEQLKSSSFLGYVGDWLVKNIVGP